MQGTMPGARRRGRPRTAWMDNIKTYTGLSVEDSIRMTEDRDKRRKYVHGVANPRIEDFLRVDGSCSKHLTVESCTVVMLLTYLLLLLLLLVFHAALTHTFQT